MLNENSRNALFESVMETLETMAFFEVTAKEEFESSYLQDSSVWSEITIIGKDGRLRIVLSVPEIFAREITAQIYADSMPVISNDILLDAIAELNNTIAGSFMLSGGVSTKDHYSLSLPATQMGIQQSWPDSTIKMQFLLDERMVLTVFCGSPGTSG